MSSRIGAPGKDAIRLIVNSSDDIVIIPDSSQTQCPAMPGARATTESPSDMSQSVIRMTYRIETAGDVAALAAKIASDQSTGTFVADARRNAGTESPRRRAGGRLCACSNPFRRRPSPRRDPDARGSYARGEADIEFPLEAIGTDLAALTTIAIGGVFSIKGFSGIRIVDMKLPPEFAAAHPGPQFGIAGSRALTGVQERPIIGIDRQAGARPAPA